MQRCRTDKALKLSLYCTLFKSPFCGFEGRAEFKLAESKDLLVVCGEFVTDVQSLEDSKEPELVLGVNRIVNHPEYQPNRVYYII